MSDKRSERAEEQRQSIGETEAAAEDHHEAPERQSEAKEGLRAKALELAELRRERATRAGAMGALSVRPEVLQPKVNYGAERPTMDQSDSWLGLISSSIPNVGTRNVADVQADVVYALKAALLEQGWVMTNRLGHWQHPDTGCEANLGFTYGEVTVFGYLPGAGPSDQPKVRVRINLTAARETYHIQYQNAVISLRNVLYAAQNLRGDFDNE